MAELTVLKKEMVYVAVSDLAPYANNARTHSDEQVAQIAASIREFGFTNPILVDEQQTIIAGHGRLAAARKLGLDEVPTITLSGLTDAQKKAYVIADNQLATNAGWDLDMLTLEIDGLKELDFDIDLLGFDDDFLTSPDFGPGGLDEQGQLDELDPKYIDCPHCGKEFDMRLNEQG